MGGLDDVHRVILVMSGKGGVGKSSTAAQLILALLSSSPDTVKVGLLDTDICGPSIPRIFSKIEGQVISSSTGWQPVAVSLSPAVNPLKLMSIAYLMPPGNPDAAIVWRGPKKTAMINQMLNQVDWGILDYLIVDTPPGTSDEHVALASELRTHRNTNSDNSFSYGAVIVTTPQLVALVPVSMQIQFCEAARIPILGILENMAGFKCSQCHTTSFIFSKEGACQLTSKHDSTTHPLLGSMPFIKDLAYLFDKGVTNLDEYRKISESHDCMMKALTKIEESFENELIFEYS